MANDKTITQRIALDGGDDIKKQLDAIGQAGVNAFGRLSSSVKVAADAGISLNTTADQINTRLTAIQENAKQLGKSFADLGGALVDVGKGLADLVKVGAAAGAALFAVSKSGADAADSARKQSQSIGTNIEDFGRLKFALSQNGVEADKVNRIFAALNDNLTSDGPNKAKTAISNLGISLSRTADGGIDTGKVIKDLADKFQKMPDGANKSSIAIDIFGKKVGQQLIPLLNKGSDGIKLLGDQAERLGIVFTKEQGIIGEELHDSFDRLTSSVTGLKNQFGLLFAEDFVHLFDALTNVIADNRQAILDIASAVRAVVVPALQSLFNVASTVFRAIFTVIEQVVAAINRVFGTNFTAQQVVIVGLATALGAAFIALTRTILGLIPGFGAFASILTGIPGVLLIVTGGFRALVSLFGIITPAVRLLALVFGGLPLAIAAVTIAIGIWIATSQNARDQISGFAVAVANAWTTAWATITGFITGQIGTIIAAVQSIPGAIQDVWNGMVELIQGVWDSILESAQAFVVSIVQFFADIGTGIVNSFNAAIETVKGFFSGLFDFASEKFKGITDFIQKIIDLAKQAASAIAGATGSGGNSSGGGGAKFARGGHVRGRGTGTSDSILAWLSNGEFVNTARAVRHYGRSFFESINSLQFPKMNLGGLVNAIGPALLPPMGIPHFADGGLVSAPASSGGVPLNIHLDGGVFPAQMQENVLSVFYRAALKAQLTRAGRKPSWYS